MQAGDLVRLIDNPSRQGTLTAQRSGTPPRERVVVNFNDGRREIQLVSALELVDDGGQVLDANDLMLHGRYGRATDLRGAITHHRLGGKLANLIYSLNTTNTEFLAYQFKPVLHFLESPSNGILIADEVGPGKMPSVCWWCARPCSSRSGLLSCPIDLAYRRRMWMRLRCWIALRMHTKILRMGLRWSPACKDCGHPVVGIRVQSRQSLQRPNCRSFYLRWGLSHP